MSIRPYKPYSVEDDNLSQVSLAPFPSFRVGRFPYQIWVSRLWGLPRFILASPPSSSLWHLRESSLQETFLRRYGLLRTWGYFFPQRNHYRHHRRCEYGLSSARAAAVRAGYYFKFALDLLQERKGLFLIWKCAESNRC